MTLTVPMQSARAEQTGVESDQRLVMYGVSWDQYTSAEHSQQLPGLDLGLATSLLDHPTIIQAVRAFRKALAG